MGSFLENRQTHAVRVLQKVSDKRFAVILLAVLLGTFPAPTFFLWFMIIRRGLEKSHFLKDFFFLIFILEFIALYSRI